MEDNSHINDDRPFRIPSMVWVLGVAVIAGVLAIFVFKVSVNTVASYAFFLFMLGSHFFMHGSHGSHGGHGGPAGHQHDSTSTTTESNKNGHSGHTGGCH